MTAEAVAERTEVETPETQAEIAPTQTEEESTPSSGTEREVQTGQADEGPSAEEVARQAEIEARAAELAAEQAKEASRKARDKERAERDRALAAQADSLIPGALSKTREALAGLQPNEYGIIPPESISQALDHINGANLTLKDSIRLSVVLPIQDAIQDVITEKRGEDGYEAFREEANGKPPAEYWRLFAETMAPKTLDEFLKDNPKANAEHKKALAAAEKKGYDTGLNGPAGSGSSSEGTRAAPAHVTYKDIQKMTPAQVMALPSDVWERAINGG